MTAQQANQQTLPECIGNLVGQGPRRPQSPDRRRYRGICRGHRQARADAEALRALGAMEGPRGRRHQSLEGHALMLAEFARLARRAGSGQVVRTGTDDATDAGDLRGNEAAVGNSPMRSATSTCSSSRLTSRSTFRRPRHSRPDAPFEPGGTAQPRRPGSLAQSTRGNVMSRPPLPPFTLAAATQKVRLAEDAWDSRDPARVALATRTGPSTRKG